MKSSVTGERNAVICLLVAGVLTGIFTHVSDACQQIDDRGNDSKYS